MKSPVPDCLIQLRRATRDIHKSIEVYTDSDRLLVGTPDLTHYRRFLSSHFLLHLQVARHSDFKLHTVTPPLLDWPHCPRIGALASDLAQLDVTINPANYTDIPCQTVGFSLGLVYVCEGSCIGNQRVLAALERPESFRHWNAKAFLSSSKIGFSKRWQALLNSIDQQTRHDDDGSGYHDIERGALAGFELYMDYWRALGETHGNHVPAEMTLQAPH